MANEVLKQIFQELQLTVVAINPNSVMDVLFSKKVISSDDYDNLRQFTVVKERCRDVITSSQIFTSSGVYSSSPGVTRRVLVDR